LSIYLGLRWITNPLFSYVFDKKILNLDTEHLKEVWWWCDDDELCCNVDLNIII